MLELLNTMLEASEALPPEDAPPEAVLAAIDAMMEKRKLAFEELKTAVQRGDEITEEMRAAAARLGELDRAWSARAESSMQALVGHMRAHRRFHRSGRRPRAAATSHFQV